MGFPSLALIGRETERTIERFPMSVAAAVAGAVAIIGEVENVRFLMIVVLGISWFLAIDLLIEGIDWKGWKRSGMRLLGVSLLVVYAFTLRPEPVSGLELIRYALFISGTHFLVAFALFVRRGSIQASWAFNASIFFRFLVSITISLVFYAGLGLAILAIDKLFNADIDTRVYYDLFALIAGPFATLFFLAGVPSREEIPEEVTAYPRGLKIFTQYVLLPIIVVYFVILYAYMGRIIVNWEWPIGWVSLPVLGFSIAGMLSFLLLYPIRDDEGNRWVRGFTRWLYFGILPLAGLLLCGIGRRVLDYGFTEPRYIVVLLGLWLVGISLYFLLSRRDNIKVIPISLAVAAFLISFGPWGAFDVSIRSQFSQLEGLLAENGMLINGKYRNNPTIDYKVASSVRSIVFYLEGHNSLDQVEGWFPDTDHPLTGNELLVLMGLDVDRGSSDQNGKGFFREMTFNAISDRLQVNVRGFDYMVELNEINRPTTILMDGISWTFVLDSSEHHINVLRGEEPVAVIQIEPTIRHLSDSVHTVEPNWGLTEYFYSFTEYKDPQILIDATVGIMRFRLILSLLVFNIDSTQFKVRRGNGQLLVATGAPTGSTSSPPVPQTPSGGVSPP